MPSDVCQVLSSVTILCLERGAIISHYASTFMYLLIESHTVVVVILAQLFTRNVILIKIIYFCYALSYHYIFLFILEKITISHGWL